MGGNVVEGRRGREVKLTSGHKDLLPQTNRVSKVLRNMDEVMRREGVSTCRDWCLPKAEKLLNMVEDKEGASE